MSEDDFTIDQVSWHTKKPGNTETREHIVTRFFAVAIFLQKHGLTKKVLASRVEDINDDFAIQSADLTERGLEVMRAAYDKWLRKVDHGLDPADTTLLEKALRKK